jgi:hypothetical protein
MTDQTPHPSQPAGADAPAPYQLASARNSAIYRTRGQRFIVIGVAIIALSLVLGIFFATAGGLGGAAFIAPVIVSVLAARYIFRGISELKKVR